MTALEHALLRYLRPWVHVRRAMAHLAKKLAEMCTRAGCTEPALDDNCMCEEHRDEHRRNSRESAERCRARKRTEEAPRISTSERHLDIVGRGVNAGVG